MNLFDVKIWVLISQTINFLVLFWILNKFLFSKISDIIDERRDEIKKLKDDTAAAYDEAKNLKEECQERLNNIKTEEAEIRRREQQKTQDSVDKMIAIAKNDSETIKEEAELEILLKRQRAWVELRSDVVDIATQAAERIITESLDDDIHRKLIGKTIDKLEESLPDHKTTIENTKAQLPHEYAENFFAKIDEIELKPLYSDFRAFVKIYNENKELHEILDSPIIEPQNKVTLFNRVFNKNIKSDVTNFIISLINEKRIHLLNKIAEEADRLYHDRKCIKGIRVRTKVPLTNAEMEKLQIVLTKKFGKLEVEEVIDSNMIGGLIIQLDNQVVDDSIDSRVKQLRESMSKIKDDWKQQIADNPSLAIM